MKTFLGITTGLFAGFIAGFSIAAIAAERIIEKERLGKKSKKFED